MGGGERVSGYLDKALGRLRHMTKSYLDCSFRDDGQSARYFVL